MVSLSTKTYKKYTIHVIITVRQKLCTNEKFKSYMYVNKKHHPDSSLRRVQPYIICNRKIVFFVLSVLTAGRCKRLLCLAAHIWIVLLHLKYCVKYWGHCPRRHFLTSLKTDLHRRSSNVGHFRTSIARLLRTILATILAARFWRASRHFFVTFPATLTQYSKIGLIRYNKLHLHSL